MEMVRYCLTQKHKYLICHNKPLREGWFSRGAPPRSAPWSISVLRLFKLLSGYALYRMLFWFCLRQGPQCYVFDVTNNLNFCSLCDQGRRSQGGYPNMEQMVTNVDVPPQSFCLLCARMVSRYNCLSSESDSVANTEPRPRGYYQTDSQSGAGPYILWYSGLDLQTS